MFVGNFLDVVFLFLKIQTRELSSQSRIVLLGLPEAAEFAIDSVSTLGLLNHIVLQGRCVSVTALF